MAWLQSHVELEDHPKLLLLKARMRWSKDETVGFLHRFWWTVLKYAPLGDVAALPPEVMSETLGRDPETLAKILGHMEQIGWLDRDGDRLLLHDWPDYVGDYLRDSLWRRRKDKWGEFCQIWKLSADSPPTVPRQSAVEERRGEKRKGEAAAAAPADDGDEVEAQVRHWLGSHPLIEYHAKNHADIKRVVKVHGWKFVDEMNRKGIARKIANRDLVNWIVGCADKEAREKVMKEPAKPKPQFQDN